MIFLLNFKPKIAEIGRVRTVDTNSKASTDNYPPFFFLRKTRAYALYAPSPSPGSTTDDLKVSLCVRACVYVYISSVLQEALLNASASASTDV